MEKIFVRVSPRHNVLMGFMDAEKFASFARFRPAEFGNSTHFSLYRHCHGEMAKNRYHRKKTNMPEQCICTTVDLDVPVLCAPPRCGQDV